MSDEHEDQQRDQQQLEAQYPELARRMERFEAEHPDVESWPDETRAFVYEKTLLRIADGADPVLALEQSVAFVREQSGIPRPASAEQHSLDMHVDYLKSQQPKRS